MTKSRHIRRILKPNLEVLRRQCEVEHIPVTELARLYGYSDISNIYSWCRRWGITPYRKPLPTDYLRAIDLTPKQHQIVLGTLLGDSSIIEDSRGGGRQAHMVFAHGKKQYTYLNWQKSQLEPFILADRPYESRQGGFSAGTLRYVYHSIAHSTFTEYRRLCYPIGIKTITTAWLERLGPIALAFWLMDDGSFHHSRGYIYLSTNAFTRGELNLAATWFEARIGYRPYIHSAGRAGQYHLAFNRIAADCLREIVRPHFFEPLLYKIGL